MKFFELDDGDLINIKSIERFRFDIQDGWVIYLNSSSFIISNNDFKKLKNILRKIK